MEYRSVLLDEIGPVDDALHWLSVLTATYSVRESFLPTIGARLEVVEAAEAENFNLVIFDGDSTRMAIVPLGQRHSIHTAREKAIQIARMVKYLDPETVESANAARLEERSMRSDFLKGEIRLNEMVDTRYGFDILMLSARVVTVKPEMPFLRCDQFEEIGMSIAPRHMPIMERVIQTYDKLGPANKWALVDSTQLMTRVNVNYVYGLENDTWIHVVADYAIPQVSPESIGTFHDRLHLIRE